MLTRTTNYYSNDLDRVFLSAKIVERDLGGVRVYQVTYKEYDFGLNTPSKIERFVECYSLRNAYLEADGYAADLEEKLIGTEDEEIMPVADAVAMIRDLRIKLEERIEKSRIKLEERIEK